MCKYASIASQGRSGVRKNKRSYLQGSLHRVEDGGEDGSQRIAVELHHSRRYTLGIIAGSEGYVFITVEMADNAITTLCDLIMEGKKRQVGMLVVQHELFSDQVGGEQQ